MNTMQLTIRSIAASLLVSMVLLAAPADAEQFDFVALGDTAYNLPADLPVYGKLIERINQTKPVFSIHVGDTWGGLPCTEENHRRVLNEFQQFSSALIYTPGDNEWTDCRKPEVLQLFSRVTSGTSTTEEAVALGKLRTLDSAFANESYGDVLGSLRLIRAIFFAQPKSLGAQPIELVRQADVSSFGEMVENAQWQHGGVQFATVHVTGSGMNFTLNDATRAEEAIARNRANIEWLKSTFQRAQEDQASAVVIAMHASLFDAGEGGDFANRELRGGDEGPYFWLALAMQELAAKFGKPVLLIHGDYHDLIIDRPFMLSRGEGAPPSLANITRLQVYGAPELKAVRVSVDTATPWVFSFSPLHN